ncbi:MAG: D-alanyl-D-alanine carboxypeptidase [Thermoleophilia bacterium]|nr:D-alanyl-D-alanine carboxypeptidase [Thermoleophilia bacterium]
MRVRRPLALVVVLGAAGLGAGIVLALGGGDKPRAGSTVSPASSAGAVESQPAPATTAPPEVPEAEGGLVPLSYGPESREARFRPKLSARAYIAVDSDTGEILVARRERRRLPIASLTKMMTALLVIEAGELGRKVRVPAEAVRVEPNLEGLREGRWYVRKQLLLSALLESTNDTVVALAYDAGHGSLSRFYGMMNARARELGMTDTTYRSPSGLNDDTNLSSARDQVIIAREALENPVFAAMVRTRVKRVSWPPPTYAKEWVNHNKMLWTYAGTFGVKTGYTTRAGGCLAVAVRRGEHSVIAVVLGSDDIWADMPRLVDEALARLAD